MEEIWKTVEWSPNFKISNFGRLKSYQRDKINGKFIKLTPSKNGYISVNLYNIHTKKIRRIGIHRLVAESFIPNPENKPQVNHIDEDKTNNRVDNLNWMTAKENLSHGTARKRSSVTRGTPVRCIETGEVFYGIWEATRKTGISNIHQACNGIYSHAGGFHWEYVEKK